MKSRFLIIAVLVAVLAAFSSVPRANAEPLTIIAIVGVVSVLSVSSVDMMVSSHEDNTDQRAQLEETERMHAKVEGTGETPGSSEVAVVAQKPDGSRSLE